MIQISFIFINEISLSSVPFCHENAIRCYMALMIVLCMLLRWTMVIVAAFAATFLRLFEIYAFGRTMCVVWCVRGMQEEGEADCCGDCPPLHLCN
jgi:hypothetical protein